MQGLESKRKQILDPLDPTPTKEANPIAHHSPKWLEDKERLTTHLMHLEVEMGELEHACLSPRTHLSMTKALWVGLEKKLVACHSRCASIDKGV